jgi:hypothetical protein
MLLKEIIFENKKGYLQNADTKSLADNAEKSFFLYNSLKLTIAY